MERREKKRKAGEKLHTKKEREKKERREKMRKEKKVPQSGLYPQPSTLQAPPSYRLKVESHVP